MTACERYEQQISVLLDGELPEEEQTELRAHLQTCADCAATYRMFSNLSAVMQDITAEPPADLTDRILAQIEKEKIVPIESAKPRRRGWKTLVATAACLAVIVGVAVFAGPNRIGSTVPAKITPPHQETVPDRTLPESGDTESTDQIGSGAALGTGVTAPLPEPESQQVLALLTEPVEAEPPAEEAEPVCAAVERSDTGEDEVTTIWIDGEDVVFTADGEHFFRTENAADSVQLLLDQTAENGN